MVPDRAGLHMGSAYDWDSLSLGSVKAGMVSVVHDGMQVFHTNHVCSPYHSYPPMMYSATFTGNPPAPRQPSNCPR